MKKKKLSAIGKAAIVGIIAFLLVVGGAIYAIYTIVNSNSDDQPPSQSTGNQSISTSSKNEEQKDSVATNVTKPVDVKDVTEVKGYCNTFAGYTAALVANGGNTTQADSYFGKAGLNVTINIEDNDDVIIEDFKNGKIDFFYMTVNKMAMVAKDLKDSSVDVVIPYLTDTSTGGDGIVASLDYNSIMDLQNAKIAVARNSVSQAIPVYLFNKTDLDTNSLMGNFIQYDSTQEAVNAFLYGEVDAVSTWDMATAASGEESKVLFSTAEGENLVIDALVFNKDFATKNPDIVKAIIDGSIAVVNDMNSGVNVEEAYDTIRASVPDFASYDDAELKATLDSSRYLGYKKNLEVFETAQSIYTSFCEVWNQLGFETNPEYVDELFDDSYLKSLESKWSNEVVVEGNDIVANEEFIANQEAIISKSAQILFVADSAEFLPGEENYKMLDEFVELAKVFNNMVIVVEGNIFVYPGGETTEGGRILSLMRAEAVKNYMVERGINPNIIITKGNGGDNPLPIEEADPNTREGREKNRRCEIMFYRGESQAEQEMQG